MKERPILMSAPMVKAILAGTKTQTRRVVKGLPLEWLAWDAFTPEFVADPANSLCPYGVPGDRLWVREAWARDDEDGELFYRADVGSGNGADDWERNRLDGVARYRWRPSIHMPRWASRILLEVTDVRVERLQDISEADAAAEGAPCYVCGAPLDGRSESDCHCFHRKAAPSDYRALWEQINGPGSWDANPFVWVISFKRVGAQGVTE